MQKDAREASGQAPPETPANALWDASQQVVERLRGLARQADAAQRILRGVPRARDAASVRSLDEVAQRLGELAAAPGELPEPVVESLLALKATAETDARELREQGPRALWAELQALAARREQALVRTGDQPLEFRVGWISFACDFERGRATAKLGLEPMHDLRLDAAAVESALEAFDKARAELADGSTCFDRLSRAYRMACAAAGVPPGTRLDLVDLLPHLALLQSDPKKLRRQGVRALEELPRHTLAMMLVRIRSERRLEHQGARLELGSATGNSTRNKANVVFVPTSERDGQYYLTIRFVPTGAAARPSEGATETPLAETVAASAPSTREPAPTDPQPRDTDAADALGQQAFDALLDQLDDPTET